MRIENPSSGGSSSSSSTLGSIVWDCGAVGTTGNKYAITVTNSGTVVDGIGGILLKTNAVATASAILGGNVVGGDYPFPSAWNKAIDFGASWLASSDTTAGYIAAMLFGYGGGAPTSAHVLTTMHMGFILDGTVLYASNASGTTQTLTDVSSGITLTRPNYFRCVVTPSTNIKFYINATLVATHTTNLPAGDFEYAKAWSAYMVNDSGNAVGRISSVGSVVMQFPTS